MSDTDGGAKWQSGLAFICVLCDNTRRKFSPMGQRLRVKVHPSSKQIRFLQHTPEDFEVWVRAKPIKGQANEAVIRLLSENLGVSPGRIRLLRGGQSRQKIFQVFK